MYARPELGGGPTTLGVSGHLWRGSMVMYDRATRSLWSQLTGEAIAGVAKGRRLEIVPSRQTSWGEWRRRHPGTQVLVKPPLRAAPEAGYYADDGALPPGRSAGDRRMGGKVLVFGVVLQGRPHAVPLADAQRRRVLQLATDEGPLLLLAAPGEGSVDAFSRVLEGRELAFRIREGRLEDVATGAAWSREGACLEGPLAGKHLPRLAGVVTYWDVWTRHWPGTVLLGDPASPSGAAPAARE